MTTFPMVQPGLQGEQRLTVESIHTARHLGSGNVEVLATPEMIRLMERAAVAVGDSIELGDVTITIEALEGEEPASLRESEELWARLMERHPEHPHAGMVKRALSRIRLKIQSLEAKTDGRVKSP